MQKCVGLTLPRRKRLIFATMGYRTVNPLRLFPGRTKGSKRSAEKRSAFRRFAFLRLGNFPLARLGPSQ